MIHSSSLTPGSWFDEVAPEFSTLLIFTTGMGTICVGKRGAHQFISAFAHHITPEGALSSIPGQSVLGPKQNW